MNDWLESMRSGPVAPVPEKANEQHYEVPARFFELALGSRLKYSGCFYPTGKESLDIAEVAMLDLSVRRAELADGQEILELGCGWGSLTLFMAERFPNSRILAVSNSAPQRRFIEGRARELGLANIEVITCDMNDFGTERRFDRVVSVEMFEHMRNWEEMLRRVRTWLKEDGRAFIHVFSHREYAYPFEAKDDSDWMSQYFFTGGMMPSDDLMTRLDESMQVDEHWVVNGRHYAQTAEHWLANTDRNKAEVMQVLIEAYGKEDAALWFHRWRVFFLACAELFRFNNGNEWAVSHYRLKPVRTLEPVG